MSMKEQQKEVVVAEISKNIVLRKLVWILLPIAALIFLYALGESAIRIAVYIAYGNPEHRLNRTLQYEPYVLSASRKYVFDAVKKVPEKTGQYRILFLGPSTVYLMDNEIARKSLSPLISQEIEIYNFGQLRYVSTQELVALSIYGLQLQPDLVITLDGVMDTIAAMMTQKTGVPIMNDSIEKAMRNPLTFGLLRIFGRSQLVNSIEYYQYRVHELDTKSLVRMTDDIIEIYTRNLKNMAYITNGIGAKYIAILQPYSYMRNNKPSIEDNIAGRYHYRKEYLIPTLKKIRRTLLNIKFPENTLYVDAIPAFDSAIGEHCFKDSVHLTDKGYKILFDYIKNKAQSQGFVFSSIESNGSLVN